MHTVYHIICPATKKPVYAGQTSQSLKQRRACHWSAAKKPKEKVSLWLSQYLEAKQKPVFSVIAQVDTKQEADALEVSEISKIRAQGFCLNVSNGGSGFGILPDEVIKQRRQTMLKKYKETDLKAKISAATKKRYQDPNERRKTGDISRRFYQDNPEAREKAAKTSRDRFSDPKERKKLSNGQNKRWSDPEQRRKHSDAIKRAWQTRRANAAKKLKES